MPIIDNEIPTLPEGRTWEELEITFNKEAERLESGDSLVPGQIAAALYRMAAEAAGDLAQGKEPQSDTFEHLSFALTDLNTIESN